MADHGRMTVKGEPYRFVETEWLFETNELPSEDWIAVPTHDGWLVPEAEYDRIWGRPN
jgi:hypothetical protein